MSKYGESLGVLELNIADVPIKLRPKKGDNLKLLRLYQNAGKDATKFIETVQPFFVEMVARDEGIGRNTPEWEELELFTELNISEIVAELMIAFKWASRDKLEAAQNEGFQKGQ